MDSPTPPIPEPPFPVWGARGAAACDHELAARAAIEILDKGGNAVDAAVALSFTLGVVCPNYSGIGGGGFMMIWRPGMDRPAVLDYRETAPNMAYTGMFAEKPHASTRGCMAAATPSLVAGLAEARDRYGRLPWAELLEPSIRIADEGFPVYPNLVRCIRSRLGVLGIYREAARLFLGPDGQGLRPGETFRFPDLAATYRRLAAEGPREFYEGETARRIVAEIRRGGGGLRARDLAKYRPLWREPVQRTYRGYEVFSIPPPSGGGIQILQMLALLEPFGLLPENAGSAATCHLQAEAMRISFAERAASMADPDFHHVPVEELLSADRLEQCRNLIDPRKATSVVDLPPLEFAPPSPKSTASYVVADSEGGWVVATESINLWFGSLVIPPGTGILLNDVMDDFSRVPGTPDAFGLVSSGTNRVEAGKRPASSSSPVMVFQGGRPLLATGSAGGPRIPTSVFQILVNVLDHGQNPQRALDFPRVHHQWLPDEIAVESSVPEDVRKALRRMGHRVVLGPDRSHGVCVMRAEGEDLFLAAGDFRSGGAAAGW